MNVPAGESVETGEEMHCADFLGSGVKKPEFVLTSTSENGTLKAAGIGAAGVDLKGVSRYEKVHTRAIHADGSPECGKAMLYRCTGV